MLVDGEAVAEVAGHDLTAFVLVLRVSMAGLVADGVRGERRIASLSPAGHGYALFGVGLSVHMFRMKSALREPLRRPRVLVPDIEEMVGRPLLQCRMLMDS